MSVKGLFDDVEDTLNAIIERTDKEQRCRTCIHRKRYALNEYSNKVIQCCELQRSKKSNSGFKTIKVTDKACGYYNRKEVRNEKRKMKVMTDVFCS